MNRHLAIVAIIGGFAFNTACSDDKPTDATTLATESEPAATSTTTTLAQPSDNTIAGTITFDGDLGSGVILVVANLVGNNGPPLYSTAISEAGPYTLTDVGDGEYTVFAFVDTANDRGAPEAGEAQGFYDANADGTTDSVVIADGVGAIDIDIALI